MRFSFVQSNHLLKIKKKQRYVVEGVRKFFTSPSLTLEDFITLQ